ncbi:MAG: 50S ribosomal protein L22 [Candidatus Niyogibacteria bacterium]|nr:50S ribosomal protein L22 [Candidatus Niyogibacteria bacterium]
MKATIRNLHIAPRKVRRIVDLIRNKSVHEAAALLKFAKEKSSKDLAKLLDSAVTNAKNTSGVEADALVISRIAVDQGAAFKRFRTKWRGMAAPIRKKTSHVTIALSERAAKEKVSPSE